MTVTKEIFKGRGDALRSVLKGIAADIYDFKNEVAMHGVDHPSQHAGEMIANLTLAFRHMEDAAMRVGKAIQASEGGESPLGGPSTPRV